jgi:hypothetical protein
MSVTGDESWFVPEDQHPAKQSVAQDVVPIKMSQTIGTTKVMLTVTWGIDGFHIVDTMPRNAVSMPNTSLLIF